MMWAFFMSKIDEIYKHFPSLNSRKRREGLISRMDELEKQGIHCFDCIGNCCTFESNSMQTSPIETVEVYLWLKSEGRWDTSLEEIKESIRLYRLDKEIATGDGTFFRRTYTCPFFKVQSKGCSLSRSIKPYGCLGFNPTETGVKEGVSCTIAKDALEKRAPDDLDFESKANQWLKNLLGLYWDKLPLPLALVKIDELLSE